ncbi:MAG: hypothetical protein ACI9C9_002350 [Marivirga sp.]|jgi:hypothetical protein
MVSTFRGWPGAGFSAADTPNLSNVPSMSQAFRDASNFNHDISSSDVSKILGFVQTLTMQMHLIRIWALGTLVLKEISMVPACLKAQTSLRR